MRIKLIAMMLAGVLCLSSCVGAQVSKESGTAPEAFPVQMERVLFTVGKNSYHINGNVINDRASYIVDGVTLVPLRVISEGLGAEVTWHEADGSIDVVRAGKTLKLKIGDSTAYVDGAAQPLLAAPVLDGDTTMVPVRFISENFGLEVSFAEARGVVSLVRREIAPAQIDEQKLAAAKQLVLDRTKNMDEACEDKFPEGAIDGKYNPTQDPGWVGGFYCGLNYLSHDWSDAAIYAQTAAATREKLENIIMKNPGSLTHDIGFTAYLSAYQEYIRSGNEASKLAVIAAGDALLRRVQEGGYIHAWDAWGDSEEGRENYYRMIADTMCNLPILCKSSQITGDAKYLDAAWLHAKRSQQYIIRDDFTTTHTYVFNPDGSPKYQRTHQGANDNSCWARGHAWVIYGMAMMYRATGDVSFLESAKNCADTYFQKTDTDLVPRWDMIYQNDETQPKDSSAASIAACGLMDIYASTNDTFYRDAAYHIFESLYDSYSTKDNPDAQNILDHATGHKPQNKNVDAGLIYGDYYFAELVARLNGSFQLEANL